MKIHFYELGTAALLMFGCHQSTSTLTPSDSPGLAAARTTLYDCADGSTVEASYPSTVTAKLRYKGQPIAMATAISASGGRYVGGGWQWWTKGMSQGTLSRLMPGESIASARGQICTAREERHRARGNDAGRASRD